MAPTLDNQPWKHVTAPCHGACLPHRRPHSLRARGKRQCRGRRTLLQVVEELYKRRLTKTDMWFLFSGHHVGKRIVAQIG